MTTRKLCRASKITTRENEIIQLISDEYSSKEIAKLLFISIETVKDHRKNIRRKLNVKNVAGLIRVAFQSRLLLLKNDDGLSPLQGVVAYAGGNLDNSFIEARH